MISRKWILTVLPVCFLLIVNPSARAQEPSIKGQFQLDELKVKGFNLFQGIYDCAVISNKKFIAFARDYSSETPHHHLRAFLVKSNGACKNSYLLVPDMGFLEAASAVWLGKKVASSPAAKGHGIVFVAYTKDPAPPYDYKIIIEAVQFNARGKSMGRKKLKEFPVNENQSFGDITLVASANDNKILLAFGGMYTNEKGDGYTTRAVTMLSELDFDGNVIRENIPIPFFEDGEMRNIAFFKPMWTGKRWFTPACITEYGVSEAAPAAQGISPSQNTLALIISGAGDNAWIKTLMIEPKNNETTANWRGFVDLSFLPPEQANSPAEISQYTLMAHHRAEIKNPAKHIYDWYVHDYYLVNVDSYQGFPIGEPKNLKIRDWKRSLKHDPNKKFDWAVDSISPVVLDQNNNMIFTHSRSFARYWREDEVWHDQSENQNILYKLNPENGKVMVLNLTDYILNSDSTYLEPHIFRLGNSIYVINNLYLGNNPWPRTSYMSVF